MATPGTATRQSIPEFPALSVPAIINDDQYGRIFNAMLCNLARAICGLRIVDVPVIGLVLDLDREGDDINPDRFATLIVRNVATANVPPSITLAGRYSAPITIANAATNAVRVGSTIIPPGTYADMVVADGVPINLTDKETSDITDQQTAAENLFADIRNSLAERKYLSYQPGSPGDICIHADDLYLQIATSDQGPADAPTAYINLSGFTSSARGDNGIQTIDNNILRIRVPGLQLEHNYRTGQYRWRIDNTGQWQTLPRNFTFSGGLASIDDINRLRGSQAIVSVLGNFNNPVTATPPGIPQRAPHQVLDQTADDRWLSPADIVRYRTARGSLPNSHVTTDKASNIVNPPAGLLWRITLPGGNIAPYTGYRLLILLDGADEIGVLPVKHLVDNASLTRVDMNVFADAESVRWSQSVSEREFSHFVYAVLATTAYYARWNQAELTVDIYHEHNISSERRFGGESFDSPGSNFGALTSRDQDQTRARASARPITNLTAYLV